MNRNMVSVMAAALTIGGCSAGADRAAAEAGVAQFHQMIDAGRYHDIYVNATDEFRRSGTEADGVRFLQMIHDRLGAVRSTASTGWRINFNPGGSTVSLSYNTQFASGSGTEDFVFRMGGPNARLVGYHVNSPALLGASGTSGAGTAEPAKPSDGSAPPQPVASVPAEPPKPPEPIATPEPAGGK